MRKIKKVEISGFWGDKDVVINFHDQINFLIGPNGSGKTTIINLIAAALEADFGTLDKFEYSKIRVEFIPLSKSDVSFIEVKKEENEDSPYSSIIFSIKTSGKADVLTFNLSELEEEQMFRHPKEYILNRRRSGRILKQNIHFALRNFVNLTWLSIHRKNSISRREEGYESTIDAKIKELSSELTKYFGILDRRYSMQTEKFQKNIFLSLIKDDSKDSSVAISNDLNSVEEKEALKEIFILFGLEESEFSVKLDDYYRSFELATRRLRNDSKDFNITDLGALIGARRIHTIVQQWNLLNKKKNKINKPKHSFIEIVNNLFQRKEVFIDERNELLVRTQSGKKFELTKLSSGEKQLLIILGQSLLQESKPHIYIADEPELSLHVEWQEKLVTSLRDINPESQIIFATHSPDIVGPYSENILQVEEAIK